MYLWSAGFILWRSCTDVIHCLKKCKEYRAANAQKFSFRVFFLSPGQIISIFFLNVVVNVLIFG